jgi:hypothetical protein
MLYPWQTLCHFNVRWQTVACVACLLLYQMFAYLSIYILNIIYKNKNTCLVLKNNSVVSGWAGSPRVHNGCAFTGATDS